MSVRLVTKRASLLLLPVLTASACIQLVGVEEKTYEPSKSDAGGPCTPKTCAQAGADCGDLSDGCNGILSCGSCWSDQTCGASKPNRCGEGVCTPTTCADANAECGLIGDGCGKTFDCGECAAPTTCGGSGLANRCGCTPTTCVAQKKTCGSISDDCGGTLECGSCKAPYACGVSEPNLCGQVVYQNSFETADVDFPTGWLVWQYCFTGLGTWRAPYPAPSNGGAYGLRMQTGPFSAGTSCGAYALSPAVSAQPGKVYRVESWSQANGLSFKGLVIAVFYNAAGVQIHAEPKDLPADWDWGPDPVVIATAPAGAATLRVRFSLGTASSVADFDLLQVSVAP